MSEYNASILDATNALVYGKMEEHVGHELVLMRVTEETAIIGDVDGLVLGCKTCSKDLEYYPDPSFLDRSIDDFQHKKVEDETGTAGDNDGTPFGG